MKYIFKIDGELKWTDKPKPDILTGGQTIPQWNFKMTEWEKTLRPLRDEQGFMELAKQEWLNTKTVVTGESIIDRFSVALSNGIEIPAERCRVIQLVNQENITEWILITSFSSPWKRKGGSRARRR